ncbi:MAG: Metallo-beta-lactamase superfamily [Firmicutes bacterium]|nr:Metallo-beta-lactamase superfamily [Bacillota bacterium]
MMGRRVIALLLLLPVLLFSGCSTLLDGHRVAVLEEGHLRVHFIDVGQGDSALIEFPNNMTMLIDGGNRPDGKAVVSYLKRAGIDSIDFLIATHPHEDHIGGLIKVVEDIPVGKVYMPRITHTSNTFMQFISLLRDKGHDLYRARSGVVILDEDGLKVEMLAPNRDSYEKLNNYSAVVKVSYRDTGIIFMGDAEKESEMEINPLKAKAQIIKIGHHGSGSSTSPEFLQAVNPGYAVISVGSNNDYGHPHAETLELLENRGIKVLRTDELGTIVITTDGSTINIVNLR